MSYGNIAIVHARFELELDNGGQRRTGKGRATEIVVRRGGNWVNPSDTSSHECGMTHARRHRVRELLIMTTVSAEGGTMPTATLTELLDREGIRYITIQHSPAFTAQEVAASAHVPGKEMAKTVVAKLDGKPALVVLPAREKVNLDQLRENSGAREVVLAAEQEFAGLFPGCELGAMPPFGNLYGLDTYVTSSLADDDEIAFNAGTHTELIKMRYRDFERVVHPKQLEVSPARAD